MSRFCGLDSLRAMGRPHAARECAHGGPASAGVQGTAAQAGSVGGRGAAEHARADVRALAIFWPRFERVVDELEDAFAPSVREEELALHPTGGEVALHGVAQAG